MNLSLQKNLFGLDVQELTTIIEQAGEPAYRARQLFQALYAGRLTSLDQISTLPKEFRSWVSEQHFHLALPEIEGKFISSDRTVRYLMGFLDGNTVETVWMPEGDEGEAGDGSEAGAELEVRPGREWRRATICVSSQVGCAVNCQFCLTALLGVTRNLTAREIVGQVIAVLNDLGVSAPTERVNLV